MNFVNEYALLFAVAIPVVAVIGINMFLAMKGEKGTLLLPALRPFPSIAIEKTVEVAPAAAATTVTATAKAPANEERMLEAA